MSAKTKGPNPLHEHARRLTELARTLLDEAEVMLDAAEQMDKEAGS